jgi:hypothetical protein
MDDLLNDVIRFDAKSSLDIVRVRPGMVGLMWEDGRSGRCRMTWCCIQRAGVYSGRYGRAHVGGREVRKC